ncbi:hypothetical protein HOD02_05235 [bacterium]|jgi:hypothetical protein|nr:hypothetical protein [bacterium]
MKQKRLETSQIIVPRPSQRTSKKGYVEYSMFDVTKRIQGLETISRNIQWYRMWWTYLRLSLEIEQKRIKIDGKLIRVSRRFYKMWSIDEILNSSFDSWWESHRHLFQEEQIESLQDVTQNSLQNYLYLKIPKKRNKSELLRELDLLLQDNLKGEKEILFPFSRSAIPYVRLHIEYNCLVMAFNGETRNHIKDWVNPRYKNISGVVQEKYVEDDDGNKLERIEEPLNYDRSVTRILRKGKDRIKRMSKGIFP